MTVPSSSSAKLYSLPAEIAFTPLRPLTGTGMLDMQLIAVPLQPLPSSPDLLLPQAMTVPFSSNAKLWLWPAAMAVTLLSPLTATGVLLQGVALPRNTHISGPVIVPTPNCPVSLPPHAATPLEVAEAGAVPAISHVAMMTARTDVAPERRTTWCCLTIGLPSLTGFHEHAVRPSDHEHNALPSLLARNLRDPLVGGIRAVEQSSK